MILYMYEKRKEYALIYSQCICINFIVLISLRDILNREEIKCQCELQFQHTEHP